MTNRHVLTQLFKQHQSLLVFLTVGGLTAVVYFSLFTLTWKWRHWDYKVAVTVSYFIAVTFQFLTNRHITFKSQDENIFSQAIKFSGLLFINYALTLFIVTWTVNTLSVSPYLGMLISLTVTVFTGFLLSRLWVFKTAGDKIG